MYDTQYLFLNPLETLMTILGGGNHKIDGTVLPPPITPPPMMYGIQYLFLDPLEGLLIIVQYNIFCYIVFFQCSFSIIQVVCIN